MKYPSYVMRMMNEATELTSRIEDLTTFLNAPRTAPIGHVEMTLMDTQCRAMTLYAKMLSARLFLATGVKP